MAALVERADVVILGGGLAGLALAERLATRSAGGRVVVVEPRTRYEDDRSWAFWAPTTSPWAAAAAARWDRWRFSVRAGGDALCAAPGWCYAMVRSSTVYDAAQRAINASADVTLATGVRALRLRRMGGQVEVETSTGPILARHVVDARPPDPGQLAASTMFQSFYGREIEWPHDAPEAIADVMADMRCDEKGFVFAYVLPLSARRGLVEITRFAPTPYGRGALAADLDALLGARGWAGARVLREESAVLPMGLPRPTGEASIDAVVRAGTAAGALRSSSGYGFLRIQAWADRCASAITGGGAPIPHPPEPGWRRWMDAVFLRALTDQPERAPEVFLRLASRVPPAALLRFLSDRANPGDVLRVMSALPSAPFLRAASSRKRVGEHAA
jgi:lycopene beta-cyclase